MPVAISPAHDHHHLLFRETAGQAIMMIVPEADNLKLEAKVDPKDIDRLQIGQPAVLRFVTFNQRTTPELNGTVTLIATTSAPA